MSEKNSATLKTPYTTQYVSHVVSSSLLELSMALMLRVAGDGSLLLWAPRPQTPQHACPTSWVLLARAGTLPGPGVFGTTLSGASYSQRAPGAGRPPAKGRERCEPGTYETYAG